MAEVAGGQRGGHPERPRTVALVHSSAGRYGADRQLALLARGLDPARYRPLVLLPEPGPLLDDLQALGVRTVVRPLAVLRRELVSPGGLAGLARSVARDAWALGRLIEREGVALVHSNTSVTLAGAAGAWRARVPHLWHVREIYADFARWWPPYRRLLLSADALACVSDAVRGQFAGATRAHTLYDGLALVPGGEPSGATGEGRRRGAPAGSGDPRTARAAARAALGVPEDRFVCAVLGRLSAWKGQDVLLRALADPRLAEVGALGLVAGDPWRGQEARADGLRDLSAGLGLGARMRLLGFREDVQTIYAAADVVVVPSTAPDPLPNAALEAAAAGCCVVASDHGGLPEIVRDGETGRLVAPGDPRSLADALAQLARAPQLVRGLGEAARVDVRARFAPELLLERVQTLYDRLLEAG